MAAIHASGAAAGRGVQSTVALGPSATADPARNARPRLATDRAGTWLAVWQASHAPGAGLGRDADVLVARSRDGGRTWTAPAPIDPGAAGDASDDQSPQATADGRGRWLVAWWATAALGGTLGEDADILVARSSDGGATWTPPAPLNANAASDAGGDYVPQIATDGRGRWIAVWWSDDSLGGTLGRDYDVLFAVSTDDGLTWTPPSALDAKAATDAGDDRCPQIATDGAGAWLVVWESTDSLGGTLPPGKHVLLARSHDGGATWTAPIALDRGDAGAPVYAGEPRIATDGERTWVVVWHATALVRGRFRPDAAILTSRSQDGGDTWTAPAPIDGSADRERRRDLQPQVASDRGGGWLVTWSSRDLSAGAGSGAARVRASRWRAGAGWSPPLSLARDGELASADGDSPDAGWDPAGHWLVAWHSSGAADQGGAESEILALRLPQARDER